MRRLTSEMVKNLAMEMKSLGIPREIARGIVHMLNSMEEATDYIIKEKVIRGWVVFFI